MTPDQTSASWAAIAAAVAAIVASWITARFKSRPEQRTADAAAKTADAAVQGEINDGFRLLVDELRKELAASRNERGKLHLAVGNLRSAINGLVQHIQSLEEIMSKHGIPIPAGPGRSMPGIESLLTEVEIDIIDFGGPAE